MKTIIAVVAGMVYSAGSLAQVEQDDMYFNKKDRAKLNKERAAKSSETFARADKPLRFDYPVQTIDNTSRNANPEYVSRSQSEMVSGEDEAAFIENYQYASQDQLNQFNNNLNSWNNNPIYSNTYFNAGINNWNSPYYSPYNDPFMSGFGNNPWNNPQFASGWSVSFGNYWGNPWNYGWGGRGFGSNICWNGGWGSPWGFGGGHWNNFYGNNFYGGGFPQVIIINDNSRGPVYGRRNSRSQQVATTTRNSSPSPSSNRPYTSGSTSNSTSNTAATRSRSRSSQSNEYYTPQWRRVPQQPNNVPGGNSTNNGSYQNRTSTNVFNSRPSSGSQQRSGSYSTPSQRSYSPSSAPSRSSSGSGGGSSRSRGGN
jgi:hypothetical protein